MIIFFFRDPPPPTSHFPRDTMKIMKRSYALKFQACSTITILFKGSPFSIVLNGRHKGFCLTYILLNNYRAKEISHKLMLSVFLLKLGIRREIVTLYLTTTIKDLILGHTARLKFKNYLLV